MLIGDHPDVDKRSMQMQTRYHFNADQRSLTQTRVTVTQTRDHCIADPEITVTHTEMTVTYTRVQCNADQRSL
jgi:hypothetical protein